MLHIFTEVAHWMHQRGDEIGATRLFATKKWERSFDIEPPPTVFISCHFLNICAKADAIEVGGKFINQKDLKGIFYTNCVRIRMFGTDELQILSDLESFKTAGKKDLCRLFDHGFFNRDLRLNTKNMISFSFTFRHNRHFNQPLFWDTRNIKYIDFMFNFAYNFNQILRWDTKNLKSAACAFDGAINFNEDLPWNVVKLHRTSFMFANTVNFTKSLEWNLINFSNLSLLNFHMFSNSRACIKIKSY